MSGLEGPALHAIMRIEGCCQLPPEKSVLAVGERAIQGLYTKMFLL
jgi:hypothetical protein